MELSPLRKFRDFVCDKYTQRQLRQRETASGRTRTTRRLSLERLESREMLAADIGEIGMLTFEQANSDAWQTVQMSRDYIDPVVIAGPLSSDGSDPAMVRVRNVDAASDTFEVQINEWLYLDGYHTTEAFSYLVVERGSHVLEDGTLLEAGTIQMNLDRDLGQEWFSPSFSTAFSDTPVVFSQLASHNGPDPAVLQQRGISSGGFQLKLREEEKRDNWHVEETVSWLAIEAGPGTNNGNTFVAGRTGQNVTQKFKGISLNDANGNPYFTAPPTFLASMQTTAGSDTANVRYRNLGSGSVQIQIDEEQSKDKEIKHAAENVGYLFWAQLGEDPTILFEKPLVDLDINSDNRNEFSQDEFTLLGFNEQEEDNIESRADLPGKYIAVNENDKDSDGVVDFADGFNRDGVDDSSDDKNLNEQFIAAVLRFGETVDLATAKFHISYSASDPNNISTDDDGALVPADGHLRLWKFTPADTTRNSSPANAMSPGDYIAPGEYTAAELGVNAAREAKLLIEGIAPSVAIGDQKITVTIDADGVGPRKFVPGDAVRATVVNLDLDIDSNNNDGFKLPEGGRLEDQLESFPSPVKFVATNTLDLDNDGIPDYADGYDLKEDNPDDGASLARFTPVKFTVPQTIELTTAKFLVVYQASDPLALATQSLSETPGSLRIWTVDGSQAGRSGESVQDGGNFVPSGPNFYSAAELNVDVETRTATWYVEGVRPSFSDNIGIFVDVDGPGADNAKTLQLFDFVSVEIGAALDLDVNNANGLRDEIDGVANFLPGYVGDTQVLTSSQEQFVNIIASGLLPGTTVKLKLANTSKLPGIASNFNSADGAYASGEGEFDYRLTDPDGAGAATLAADGQLLSGLVVGDSGQLTVPLSVRDFGGSTTVQILDSDDNILGSLQVPLDQDGDKLPDLWEDLYATAPANYSGFDKTKSETIGGKNDFDRDDDLNDVDDMTVGEDEEVRTGKTQGDLLSAFDEYRGFIASGNHVRPDPLIKSVFIKDELGDIVIGKNEAGEDLLLTNKLELFPAVGVEVILVGDGEYEEEAFSNMPKTFRKLNFNSINSINNTVQDVIVLRRSASAGTDGNWGQTNSLRNVDNQRERISNLYIGLFTRQLELMADLPDNGAMVPFLFYREDPLSVSDEWANGGRIRIGDELFSYETGENGSGTKQYVNAVTIPKDSTTVLIGDISQPRIHIDNPAGGADEAIEISMPVPGSLGKTVVSADNAANTIQTTFNDLVSPKPFDTFLYAKIEKGDAVEWITFEDIEFVNGVGYRLKDVARAQLGSGMIADIAGASIDVPRQAINSIRGAFGTERHDIAVDAVMSVVGYLTNVERAQGDSAVEEHLAGKKFGVFDNVELSVQSVIAHELAHAIQNEGESVEHIAETIMRSGNERGRSVDGEHVDGKHFVKFSNETRKILDLL